MGSELQKSYLKRRRSSYVTGKANQVKDNYYKMKQKAKNRANT